MKKLIKSIKSLIKTEKLINEFSEKPKICENHFPHKTLIKTEYCNSCNISTCYICSNSHLIKSKCDIKSFFKKKKI